jgi:hypothetical protein
VPDCGVLRGRRAGGVITLARSVRTRGAASTMLAIGRLAGAMLYCSVWWYGAGGRAAGSECRWVRGVDAEW